MRSLNRKQRRANKTLKGVAVSKHRPLPDDFQEKFDRLAVLGGFAQHVSISQTGQPTSTSGMLASAVFAKCCAHARSIGAIAIESPMFDHHAIMALARMIVEASTMIAYLLDPVSSDEWALRHSVLRLHDTVGRIKLLRSYDQPSDDLRKGRDELKVDIISNPNFQKIPEQRRDRLLTGEEMFTIGMRSVAIKIMGWEEKQFSGVYAYFSSHTHFAPMSFMRMEQHEIDYFYPSKTQTDILSLSMEVAMACLRRSLLRMIDLRPEDIDAEYHPDVLARTREEDAECPFFAKIAAGLAN